jgi:hypothetical protein
MNNPNILQLVREKAAQRILYLPHAVRQMSRPDRLIATSDVRRAIAEGEIIEDYPNDARGHSCLVFGPGIGDRPIHVVCSPKDEYLAIITAYIPCPDQWAADFKSRRAK